MKHSIRRARRTNSNNHWSTKKQQNPKPHDQRSFRRRSGKRLHRNTGIEAPVLGWDMKYYQFHDFLAWYGDHGPQCWQHAKQASADAIAVLGSCIFRDKNMLQQESYQRKTFFESMQALIRIDAGSKRDPHISDKVVDFMLTIFYVPLRWRYDCLQSMKINRDKWTEFDLNVKLHQKQSWDFLRKCVRSLAGQAKPELQKYCEKLSIDLLRHGVGDQTMLTRILVETVN